MRGPSEVIHDARGARARETGKGKDTKSFGWVKIYWYSGTGNGNRNDRNEEEKRESLSCGSVWSAVEVRSAREV